MVRQGVYTKKLTPWQWAKRGFQRRWRWFRELSWWRKFLLIGGPILLFLVLTPLLTYLYFAADISDPERLMNRSNTGVVLLDKNGEEFYTFGRAGHREIIPLDQIADITEKALLSAEDKGFYEHSGFSIPSIVGALYANFLSGDATAYGGSTLTQQLAKNTLLTEDQTFLRKYQELSIAIAIEQNYTKDEILALYLNSAYFGEGAFGIKDAASTYFNKSPQDLTLAESAMLIGVLPAPTAYSPISGNPEYAKERQTTVLDRMVDNNVITEAEKKEALATKLAYAEVKDPTDNEAPHYTEMVLNELYEEYGEEKVNRSGFQVTTGLDLNLQRRANENVANQMPAITQSGGSNAGLVAIDPKTGEIRALVGSADWNNTDFGKVNMAITPRQPGSSFKPVYFSEALAEGVVTPATVLRDEPTDFGGYTPENYDFRYRGDITVRDALGQSLNIPAVKVMEKLGVADAVKAAERMGITTLGDPSKYGLSLALGAAEAKLVEMTNVYAAFAQNGQQKPYTTISSIKNKFDEETAKNDASGKRVLSEGGAYLISNILSDDAARAPTFGASLNVYGRDVAVKTGTTDDARDAWTIGYTPQIAVGVWVGNNDNTVMQYGGSTLAGPIWKSTLEAALEGQPAEEFTRPSKVVEVLICADGTRASNYGPGVRSEVFLRSDQPTGNCTVPTEQREEERQPEREEETRPPRNNNSPEPTEPPEEEEEETPPTDTEEETPPSGGGGDTGTGGGSNGGSGNGSGNGGGTTPPSTSP